MFIQPFTAFTTNSASLSDYPGLAKPLPSVMTIRLFLARYLYSKVLTQKVFKKICISVILEFAIPLSTINLEDGGYIGRTAREERK